MGKISCINTPDYSAEAMEAAVGSHFSALGTDALFKPGMKVCIKPNLLMKKRPEECTTTHPALVKAVIQKIQSLGVKDIVIADSPGGPFTAPLLEGIYKASGIAEVAAQTGAALNYDTGFRAIRRDNASICSEFNIINPIADADIIVNLPKLKTHGMLMMSAAVKNLFGCVPGLQKPGLHMRFRDKSDFCKMIVDLSLLVAPSLTIVDAVESMEGNGPSVGIVRKTGLTFASTDIHCLDQALCDYIGMNPDDVPTVKHAADMGLTPKDASGTEWLGIKPEKINDYLKPDSHSIDFTHHVPALFRRPASFIMKKFFTPRPVIITRKCIGCGKCEESCAPRAAVVHNRKAGIDYDKCIGCYCCHELCPVKAVEIKKSRLFS